MNAKLAPAQRVAINHALVNAKLDGNGRFESVGKALAATGAVLTAFGIEWDETLNSHLFMAPSGYRNLHIALSNEADPFSPAPITNSMVAFSWHKHDATGMYEAVVYVS